MRTKRFASLLRRIHSQRFQKLFLKNTAYVFLGIVLPLVISVVAIFSFSHRTLMEETDAANLRSLDNTRSTMDMLFSETDSMLLSYTVHPDVVSLLNTKKAVHPNYPYIKNANNILTYLRLSRRPYLDTAITLYSELSDFTLSTTLGGQSHRFFGDQEMVPLYRAMKDRYPERNIFLCLRRAAPSASAEDAPWTLVIYRTIATAQSPRYSFICIDINLPLFSAHLTDSDNAAGGAILLVDEDGRILFDSTGQHTGAPVEGLFAQPALAETFALSGQGALTLTLGGDVYRMSWMPLSWGNLRCIQLAPFDDYVASMRRLQEFLIITIILGVLISIAISFFVSLHLFRPIETITRIVEDPASYNMDGDRSGEIQYVFMNILDSFQRNIALEEEMIGKLSALRNARARALQEQMTPHFLYNALQSIHWLAIMETGMEEGRTSRSVLTLSKIMRYCMEQSDNFATVRREIEFVKRYMEIARLRFEDAIECHFNLDEAAMGERIPRVSIQPLVENAVSHGFQPKGGKGKLYVDVAMAPEGLICVTVQDDGLGMTAEQMQNVREQCDKEFVYANQNVGLVNLSQRIKILYGEVYGIALSHSPYGGLKVEFAIPRVEMPGQFAHPAGK